MFGTIRNAQPMPVSAEQPVEPRRPMKVGLFLPTGDTMLDGGTARWADLLAMARLAEDVGFDSLWVADHLIMERPTMQVGVWECWTLLAALAAATRRIALGPFVSCMGFRNPALLAKMADAVDEVSGGRLILGLGAGWHEPEYRAFGYPFDHRYGRFEEGIRIIHGLLRDGQVDFAGQYYEARECVLRPRGPRPQGPPIMVGTRGERMLRLVARYADAWNTDWVLPADLPAQQATVDAACAAEGREPATLERMAATHIDLPGVERRPFGDARQRTTGTPEELAAFLRSFADAGITHMQIWLAPNTPAGIEAFAPVLELLDGA
jgi:probable F420-dependent oxidoreductase